MASFHPHDIPDQLSSSLSYIVRQIDILTQTMNILEVQFIKFRVD
jgi:hypothetical protein